MQGRLRGRHEMPRLDLCAAGLRRPVGALLSQGQGQAAVPQALLHLGRGALNAAAPVQNPVDSRSSARMMLSRSFASEARGAPSVLLRTVTTSCVMIAKALP